MIKRPLLKFMLSLVLRHSIKKALVRDKFTEVVLKRFANRTGTKVTTIGDPALFLKEWEDGNGANKKKDGSHRTLFNHTAKIFVSARDLDLGSQIIMQDALLIYLMNLLKSFIKKLE